MERYLRKKLAGGKFSNVHPARSATMGKIRGKGNRTTELRLRFALVRARISGWQLHTKVSGNPDFFFAKHRVALFVDGCFWHGCPKCGHIPNTNRAFWKAKIERNQQRAKRWDKALKKSGISAHHIWECELKKDLSSMVKEIVVLLRERGKRRAAQ